MNISFWYFLKHWKGKWKIISHEDLKAAYYNWKNADRKPGLESWLCYWLVVYNLVMSCNVSELQHPHFIQWGEIKLSISFLPALLMFSNSSSPRDLSSTWYEASGLFLVLNRQSLTWPSVWTQSHLNYMSLGIGKQNYWHICKGSCFFNFEASIFKNTLKCSISFNI